MRIAIFSWESLHSIPVGGVANHVTELAAAMERHGHEVHVFTRLGAGQLPYERIDGVHYHRCMFQSHADFLAEINNMCNSMTWSLGETEALIGRFDVAHGHDWLTSKAVAQAKYDRHMPVVFTIHSTEFGRCGNCSHGGQSQRIREFEREGIHCADRVIAVSETLRREIQEQYQAPPDKVQVIYNGVHAQGFDGFIDAGAVRGRYGIGPLDPMVLFCGRMTWQKGPDLLLEASALIRVTHPNTKFVFVGEGDMRSGLEDRARQIGVADNTRFLGFRQGTELIDLYKSADVVCIPSRNEPFGIVILEAWSAGKPVVASLNGGPSEFVKHEHNGLKVYPSPDSIAWGVGTMFTDFERARWMGRNGRQDAEQHFTWGHIAERAIQVYHQAIA